jgi:hypothetical protein
MTRRIGTTIGIVAALLLLAILAGVVGLLYARPATAQTAGVPGMRQVSVAGHGEVKGRPDTATVQIGVESEAATAKEALAQNPDDHQARFDLALIQNARGEREAAADNLLAIIKADRTWNDDAARAKLLELFDAWGPAESLTLATRRRLSSLLFS